MQTIVVHIVILGLMVFVFGVISRSRRDDRLRCWQAGWICILAHYLVEFAHPASALGQHLLEFAFFGTIVLAGAFFIVSTMAQSEGRRAAVRLWGTICLVTLPIVALISFHCRNVWILAAAIVARQSIAIYRSSRPRPNRVLVASSLAVAFVAAGAWSLYGIFTGHPLIVIQALLSELFLAAAIDFWGNGWPRTVGLHTMAVGMLSWALVFPVREWIHSIWPQVALTGEMWLMPRVCMACGILLLVVEEETHTAQRISDEYRLIFHNNPHPLWIFEADTLRFVAVNQAGLDLHGYNRHQFLQLHLSDVLDPDTEGTAEIYSESTPGSRSARHLRRDGSVVPLDIQAHDIVFEGKQCRFVLGLDVSERDELERQLFRQARHDALTGLPNRMLFEDQLTAAVARATKTRQKLAILCLDMCRFKHINDVYGPRIGDECIKKVAHVLNTGLREGDLVARTGGDEFTIVLSGIRNAASVEQTANAVQAKFEQPLLVQGHTIPISFSMGLAIFPDDGSDAVTLWQGAESVMRRAQEIGGGQAIWLSPELRAEAEQQIEIESSMRSKIEESGFHLAYQPVYGFDGRIRSLEALLRFEHATYGRVSPTKVIPIAEETGLIFPMGLWVVDQVCKQLRIWMEQGMQLVPVAINVSALQLMNTGFAEQVMKALVHYQIDPKWIHLEVTETAAMKNLKEVSGQMAALAAVGISFSIDDFGTGHSSLGRLHQLPISVLKIDRSFVEQLSGTYNTHMPFTIVQAILSMAHALGQKVVAEGVETPAQLACLRGLKCDLLQGFLLSRPVPPEQIPAMTVTVHPAFAESSRNEYVPSRSEQSERVFD